MITVTPEVEARAREILSRLTLTEKLRMLAGDQDFYQDMVAMGSPDYQFQLASGAGVPRVGLKGVVFTDGPRGVAFGTATCFPVPMARAATFDPTLEERVGEAIGREARARGANLCGAPCLNLPRHPAWGRSQETYGENSDHIGEMAAAMVRGLQKHVMACPKHYACNSTENGRFSVDVRVSEEDLEKVYLPHFRRAVEEGAASVMSAYNSVNGEWCGQNRYLLTTILKERWGFDGFVVSDFVFGIRDGVAAVNAGMDLEMPARLFIDDRVVEAVDRGEIALQRVDDAVLRLIRQQLRFEQVGDGDYGPEVVACEKHRALAREVATRAIVLLKNEPVEGRPVLPLDTGRLRRLAVIGRLAAVPNTGDRGSSKVNAPYVVTPLEGLRAALEPLGVEVLHDAGDDPGRAAALAAAADAAIVVVGYDYHDEGEFMGEFPPNEFKHILPPPPPELAAQVQAAMAAIESGSGGLTSGGDRRSLSLHAEDEALVLSVAAANSRTIAALMCGNAVIMERWRQAVPGILILWYPGMEGGHAFADVVLGKERPTGRLPFSIPTSEEHLPSFDRTATVLEYGSLHGQALLDHLGVAAAFPYGFGLTYDD
jgi:beta-glucosidase